MSKTQNQSIKFVSAPFLSGQAIMESALRSTHCCCRAINSSISLLSMHFMIAIVSIFMMIFLQCHPFYHQDIGNTHFWLQIIMFAVGCVVAVINICAIYTRNHKLWSKVYYFVSVFMIIVACILCIYLVVTRVSLWYNDDFKQTLLWNNFVINAFGIDASYITIWVLTNYMTKKVIDKIRITENTKFESLRMDYYQIDESV
eukprot:453600_1